MDADELTALYDTLTTLVTEGKEDEAQKLLADVMSRLPQELQEEIVFEAVSQTIKDRAEEIEAQEEIQTDILVAMRILAKAKEAMEKEGRQRSS